MKKKWIALIAPPAIVLIAWLFGEATMHLWNWLMPALFGLKLITFWQALGLAILFRFLFGGFGGHGNHGPHGRHHKCLHSERWERMTPEERDRFTQAARTGAAGPPAHAGESA